MSALKGHKRQCRLGLVGLCWIEKGRPSCFSLGRVDAWPYLRDDPFFLVSIDLRFVISGQICQKKLPRLISLFGFCKSISFRCVCSAISHLEFGPCLQGNSLLGLVAVRVVGYRLQQMTFVCFSDDSVEVHKCFLSTAFLPGAVIGVGRGRPKVSVEATVSAYQGEWFTTKIAELLNQKTKYLVPKCQTLVPFSSFLLSLL